MKKTNIFIVGAVAGGLNTALEIVKRDYTRFLITIIEKQSHLGYSTCGLPYGLGESLSDDSALFGPSASILEKYYPVKIKTNEEAVLINREARQLVTKNAENEQIYDYDYLILSPGRRAKTLPIKSLTYGQDYFSLHTPSDYEKMQLFIKENNVKHVAIIGAGYIGIELAEQLNSRGLKVSLINKDSTIMSRQLFPEISRQIQSKLVGKGVNLYNNQTVDRAQKNGKNLTLSLDSGDSLTCDLLIAAIGTTPNNELAETSGLDTCENTGCIKVNDKLLTSDPSIYALGDVITVTNWLGESNYPIALADYAHRQARVVAEQLCGNSFASYKPAVPSSIIKLYDEAFALAGLNYRELNTYPEPWDYVIVNDLSNSSYFGNAEPLTIIVAYRIRDGLLLSAQAIGKKGIDKRLDILSIALKAQWTLDDLAQVDLVYSPPYSSPKDPIHTAANKALLLQEKKSSHLQIRNLFNKTDCYTLIDLRKSEAYKQASLPKAINKPFKGLLHNIDTLLNELDSKPVVCYDEYDEKAVYIANALKQHGVEAYSLEGGFTAWKLMSENL